MDLEERTLEDTLGKSCTVCGAELTEPEIQAASPGRRFAQPHSWIMIHEPAKWAGWQSTSAAAQHLDRLKQMQAQIYEILSARSGRPLNKIIRDTKRTDFYLDATKALEYGLIDGIVDS